MKIGQALFPIHLVSKLFCVGPFALYNLRPSMLGSILTIAEAFGYIIFHLWMVNRDMSEESKKNLVGIIIDSYNRYSGFCAFCLLVGASVAMQHKIFNGIQILECVDYILEEKFKIATNNRIWRR